MGEFAVSQIFFIHFPAHAVSNSVSGLRIVSVRNVNRNVYNSYCFFTPSPSSLNPSHKAVVFDFNLVAIFLLKS